MKKSLWLDKKQWVQAEIQQIQFKQNKQKFHCEGAQSGCGISILWVIQTPKSKHLN